MTSMPSINLEDVHRFISENIRAMFHAPRLESLRQLKIDKVLKRKNPYLFRAKNITTANQLASALLEAHLSSSEETHFGSFLEEIAI